MSDRIAPKLLVEFIGTFALIFIGAGAAAILGLALILLGWLRSQAAPDHLPKQLWWAGAGAVVLVLGPLRCDATRWVVRMPSAGTFHSTSTLGGRECHDITALDQAVSDSDGNVRLEDGRYVHSIDFNPTTMHCEFTIEQRAVVRHHGRSHHSLRE